MADSIIIKQIPLGPFQVLSYLVACPQTKEAVVGSSAMLNVQLEVEAVQLDGVVVTALGLTREKKSLGYSVAEVDGEDMTRVAQENVINSLAG